MNDTKEIKILKNIVKKSESKGSGVITRLWFNPVLWIFCTVIFLIALQYHQRTGNTLVLVFTTGLVGILVGAISILQASEKTWPVIKQYIDIEAVKKQIDEARK